MAGPGKAFQFKLLQERMTYRLCELTVFSPQSCLKLQVGVVFLTSA